jgi:hypothetical protein
MGPPRERQSAITVSRARGERRSTINTAELSDGALVIGVRAAAHYRRDNPD